MRHHTFYWAAASQWVLQMSTKPEYNLLFYCEAKGNGVVGMQSVCTVLLKWWVLSAWDLAQVWHLTKWKNNNKMAWFQSSYSVYLELDKALRGIFFLHVRMKGDMCNGTGVIHRGKPPKVFSAVPLSSAELLCHCSGFTTRRFLLVGPVSLIGAWKYLTSFKPVRVVPKNHKCSCLSC